MVATPRLAMATVWPVTVRTRCKRDQARMRTGSWRGPRIWPTLQTTASGSASSNSGKRREELLDRDAQLEPGEVGPEAAVDPEPERGVAVLERGR